MNETTAIFHLERASMKHSSASSIVLKALFLTCFLTIFTSFCSTVTLADGIATQNFAQLAYQQSLQNPPASPTGSSSVSVPQPLYQEPGTITTAQTIPAITPNEHQRTELSPRSLPFAPSSTAPSPLPAASFLGLADGDQRDPPDTQGSVGPSYVMTVTNDEIAMRSRATGGTTTASLQGFWSPVTSTDPAGTFGVFDPRVVYDPYAQR